MKPGEIYKHPNNIYCDLYVLVGINPDNKEYWMVRSLFKTPESNKRILSFQWFNVSEETLNYCQKVWPVD